MYIEEILDMGKDKEEWHEKSLELNYVDLTLDPNTIFEVNPYSHKIREKMGKDAEMSKQLEIFHLKN